MAQLQSDKYNIAWFKLAEFVGRKEKEKALAIYRLLAHSLQDEALSLQLEGDLLLSFNDEKAIDSYIKSASLYETNGKIREAAGLYEHLFFLTPNAINYIYKMLDLYRKIDNEAKTLKILTLLANYLITENKLEEIDSILEKHTLSCKASGVFHEFIVIQLLQEKIADQIYINKHIQKAIDNLEKENTKLLQLFLAKISALDMQAHDYACKYLKKSD